MSASYLTKLMKLEQKKSVKNRSFSPVWLLKKCLLVQLYKVKCIRIVCAQFAVRYFA